MGSAMAITWRENGDGGIETEVEAYDRIVKDEREIKTFTYGGGTSTSKSKTPVSALSWRWILMLLGAGWYVVVIAEMMLECTTATKLSPASFWPLVVGCASLFMALFLRSVRRTRAANALTRDRFAVSLDRNGLRVTGRSGTKHWPLEVIDRIEGERAGVAVVHKQTLQRDLVRFELDDPRDHPDVAARLNDALVNVRAGDGYRGLPVRVAIEEPKQPDEALAEAAEAEASESSDEASPRRARG